MISLFFSAVMIGLAGAGHCLGMCGGLASLLAINGQPSSARIISYNLGRTASYLLFALILSSTFQFGLSHLYTDLMIPLRTFAGVLLVLMGLYICGLSKLILKIESLGRYGWKAIQPLAKKLLPIETNQQAFIAGVLWGWLPCGLVYSTVLWASSLGSISLSLLAMLGFAAGTLPAMLLAGFFSQQLKQIWQTYYLNWLFGLFMCLYGLYSIPAIKNVISLP